MFSLKSEIKNCDIAEASIIVFLCLVFTLIFFPATVYVLASTVSLPAAPLVISSFVSWAVFWIYNIYAVAKSMTNWDDSRFDSKVYQVIPLIVVLISLPNFMIGDTSAWNDLKVILLAFEIFIVGFYLTHFTLLAIIPRWPTLSDWTGFALVSLSILLGFTFR